MPRDPDPRRLPVVRVAGISRRSRDRLRGRERAASQRLVHPGRGRPAPPRPHRRLQDHPERGYALRPRLRQGRRRRGRRAPREGLRRIRSGRGVTRRPGREPRDAVRLRDDPPALGPSRRESLARPIRLGGTATTRSTPSAPPRRASRWRCRASGGSYLGTPALPAGTPELAFVDAYETSPTLASAGD